MSCIYNIREKLKQMSFVSSQPGEPSEFFCKLHKYRLTKPELKEKQCLEKGCKHLTHWKYVKRLYRK